VQSVPSTAITPNSSGITFTNKINLLDLATAYVADMDTASKSITAKWAAQQNNVQLKPNGSFVTNADFTAQGGIFKAIRLAEIDVLGEESADKEMTAQLDVAAGPDDFLLQQKISLPSTINCSGQALFFPEWQSS
jgi:3'-phosphoadenosine 5'-phosphosulfate (PAPS) 3'-phosphatase